MIKNILASVAAAGLLVAPIAAQANTRASDSQVSLAALGDTSARTGSIAGDAESINGGATLLILLFGALAAAIILLVESGEDDASPGTGG